MNNIKVRNGDKIKTYKNYSRAKALEIFCKTCANQQGAPDSYSCIDNLCPLWVFRPYRKNLSNC
jgi:hypothetical protein